MRKLKFIIKKCIVCGKKIKTRFKTKRYCSEKCRYRLRIKENRGYWQIHKEYLQKLYRKKREYIEKYKLTKGCQKCGYKKCPEALVFHHFKGKKEFNISHYIASKNLRKIKKEIKKCIVVCANCHAEIHFAFTGLRG